MAIRSTAHSRLALLGLAVAGVLAGSAGGAAAQYYYYDEVYRGYDYGYRYAPRPPAPIPPRAIGRIAAREFGLARLDRLVRNGSSYVVDGEAANGQRTRLIFDAHSGELIDHIILRAPRRQAPAPDVARVDPREEHRPAQPRLVPRPPQRPAALKPPGQANAPATVVPPSPAAPPRAPEPEKPTENPPASANAPATTISPAPAAPEPPVSERPAETPPVSAHAPATTVPAAPAAPPEPSPGPINPGTGEDKPKLVNPADVRGTSEPDHQPPLAKADPSGISVAPVEMPPVQIQDPAPSQPRPETPAVPVAPLN